MILLGRKKPIELIFLLMNQQFINQCSLALLKGLGCLPQPLNELLTRLGGFAADRSKGQIARAAIKIALPEADDKTINAIAKKAAYNSFGYILSLSRLEKIPYQLHDLDVVKHALSQNRGVIIVSLHMGPPDIGTLALTREKIPISTVIGAGNQKPWLNNIGQYVLKKAGIRFVQRGNPMAVMKTLRKKEAIVLHSDMRSREAPVTFFGEQTTAPISAVNTALMLKTPIVFHYCTWKGQTWQLHFEPFELDQSTNREDAARLSLQALMHRMEEVIRKDPELWIWHYDRFKLKKKLKGVQPGFN